MAAGKDVKTGGCCAQCDAGAWRYLGDLRKDLVGSLLADASKVAEKGRG